MKKSEQDPNELIGNLNKEISSLLDKNSKILTIKNKYVFYVLVDLDSRLKNISARYNKGYIEVSIKKKINDKNKVYVLSRYILGVTDRLKVVDHINRNTLDNRWCNIREASRCQNAQNIKGAERVGLYKGITSNGKRITGMNIQAFYKRINIRCSDEVLKVLFAMVYDCFAIKQSGEFSLTNFDRSIYSKELIEFVHSKLLPTAHIETRTPHKNKSKN